MEIDRVMEKFGIYFDEAGLSKTYGRMFGFFMTSSSPASMSQIVEKLQISKSTASTELRRLWAMGVIEKVFVPDTRADFYQLKENIWSVNLNQKIHDIKRLRSIIEEIPQHKLYDSPHLKDMADYCTFLEPELRILSTKYLQYQSSKNLLVGSFSERINDKFYRLECFKLPALSKEFAEKMSSLSMLGIQSFRTVEIEFLKANPLAAYEDKHLAMFKGLEGETLEDRMTAKLQTIFHCDPKDMHEKLREIMKNFYYYLATIREESSDRILGFITFMSGGSIPPQTYKITVLAIDETLRRSGLATCLISVLDKVNVPYTKLFLSTRPSNHTALQAYKKWGFTEDQEISENLSLQFVKGHWIHLARQRIVGDSI